MAKKDLRDLIKDLKGQNFVVVKARRNGHHKVYKTNEQGNLYLVASLASTPSDARTMENSYRDLRRAGYEKPR